jgi:hypothetical protein
MSHFPGLVEQPVETDYCGEQQVETEYCAPAITRADLEGTSSSEEGSSEEDPLPTVGGLSAAEEDHLYNLAPASFQSPIRRRRLYSEATSSSNIDAENSVWATPRTFAGDDIVADQPEVEDEEPPYRPQMPELRQDEPNTAEPVVAPNRGQSALEWCKQDRNCIMICAFVAVEILIFSFILALAMAGLYCAMVGCGNSLSQMDAAPALDLKAPPPALNVTARKIQSYLTKNGVEHEVYFCQKGLESKLVYIRKDKVDAMRARNISATHICRMV